MHSGNGRPLREGQVESGAATRSTKARAKGGQSLSRRTARGTTTVDTAALNRLLAALESMRDGNFRKRLTVSDEA